MYIFPKQNTDYLKLAGLQTILILSLVPNARSIETYIKSVSQIVPAELKIILLAILGAIIIKISLNSLKNKANFPYLFGICTVMAIAFYLDPLPVEVSHLFLYAPLSYFFIFGLKKNQEISSKKEVLPALIYSQIVSLSDEGLQHLHPERFFDLRDLVFNLLGALLGLFCARIIDPGSQCKHKDSESKDPAASIL